MIFWKPRRCHRCQQTLHRLDGSIAEPRHDGGPQDVWHYHYGCWYALLKERGEQWLEPCAPGDRHTASGTPA